MLYFCLSIVNFVEFSFFPFDGSTALDFTRKKLMTNLFFWIILLSLLAEYALDVAANVLNLRALKLEPPTALAGLYNPDEYRKSQEYTRVNTRFGLFAATFQLNLTMVFWFAGGFNYLNQVILSFEVPFVANGLLYTGAIALLYGFIMLPFNIYHTFVIEERFGFNRTTPVTYVSDLFKGLALSVVLGAPLIAGFLLLFAYLGRIAWLYCFAAVALFTIGVQYLAPILIMPLFNKFTPLENQELKQAIIEYAHSVGYRVGGIFVMNGSKRSIRANAFFTGFGATKRIALFDTLIEQITISEIVAVLAHEIGHYKYNHTLIGLALSIIETGIVLFLLSLFIYSPGLYTAFGLDALSLYAGLVFFGLLFTPVEMALSFISEVISRRDETQADRFAAMTVKNPEDMSNALKKLSVNNLTNLTPSPFFVFLNYSHPTLLERINTIHGVEAERKAKEEKSPAVRV